MPLYPFTQASSIPPRAKRCRGCRPSAATELSPPTWAASAAGQLVRNIHHFIRELEMRFFLPYAHSESDLSICLRSAISNSTQSMLPGLSGSYAHSPQSAATSVFELWIARNSSWKYRSRRIWHCIASIMTGSRPPGRINCVCKSCAQRVLRGINHKSGSTIDLHTEW